MALVVGIWIATPFVISRLIESPEDRGAFGNQFGAISTLFSGLAFLGLIWTIHLQRKDLAYQRGELKVQREELKQNTLELENQAQALKGQLDAAKISAKLSALPNLIEAEARHLSEVAEKPKTSYIGESVNHLSEYLSHLQKKADKFRCALLDNLDSIEVDGTIYSSIDSMQGRLTVLLDEVDSLERLVNYRTQQINLYNALDSIGD
jgi:hypothetical protein